MRWYGWIVAMALLAFAPCSDGATWSAAGVLGNSGSEGSGLVHVGRFDMGEEVSHVNNRCATGMAMDADGTIYVSGGDRINRISLDGRLVESFPVEPAGSLVHSWTFAVLDNTLYFFAHQKPNDDQLYSLPMKTGARAGLASLKLPLRKRPDYPYRMAAEPLDGKLVLVTVPAEEQPKDRAAVYLLDPKSGTVAEAFRCEGAYPSGIAVDSSRRRIYVGLLAELPAGPEYQIMAYQSDGALAPGFPVPCTKAPAIPIQFRGVLSVAAGALWDSAWYGFLARLDMNGAGDPGQVLRWCHELTYPTQVLGIGQAESGEGERVPLLIATANPEAVYCAVWDRAERRLQLVRRIGALPVISGLGLSTDGNVAISTAWSTLWWQWDDAASAPPRKADMHIAITPGVFDGERFSALGASCRLSNLTEDRSDGIRAMVFSPRPGGFGEPARSTEPVPVKKPVGLSVQLAPSTGVPSIFVTDAGEKQVWRADFQPSTMFPDPNTWRCVSIEGPPLKAPTDIVALRDGRLLVADSGCVLMLKPGEAAYRVEWQFDHWGEKPADRFGKDIRFAADGANLLVSDTERHRLIYVDWTSQTVLAQFGETDRAGGDLLHLDRPGLVSLQGNRAVVADTGNQRVVKLALAP